jgi:hypothetical protein
MVSFVVASRSPGPASVALRAPSAGPGERAPQPCTVINFPFGLTISETARGASRRDAATPAASGALANNIRSGDLRTTTAKKHRRDACSTRRRKDTGGTPTPLLGDPPSPRLRRTRRRGQLETCISAKRTGLENVEFTADVSGWQGVRICGPIFSIRFVWTEIGRFRTSCEVDISSCRQLRRALCRRFWRTKWWW